MSELYHVSFVYDDYRGLETFEEFTVEADDEEEAVEFAKHMPGAPSEYKEANVQSWS